MTNKKGQALPIFLVVVGALALFGLIYLVTSGNPSETGDVTNTGNNCNQSIVPAKYIVSGDISCSGKGGILYGGAHCAIKIQNTEQQLISVEPEFQCKTLTRTESVIAQKQALLSKETKTIEIEWKNRGEDWVCTLTNANAEKIVEICA